MITSKVDDDNLKIDDEEDDEAEEDEAEDDDKVSPVCPPCTPSSSEPKHHTLGPANPIMMTTAGDDDSFQFVHKKHCNLQTSTLGC